MKTVIVIPARYHSTRLPGKPLMMIRGQTMLKRVVDIARRAAAMHHDVSLLVATDDARIMQHCQALEVDAVMTSADLATGTDRVADALKQANLQADFVLNMQGDAPLTPPDFLWQMMQAFEAAPSDVVTPVTQLSWQALDKLRDNKKSTPFSGTTAVFNQQTGEAYWFSKQIIPAIRQEKSLREASDKSPVFRHIGLYGYARETLEHFISLQESAYEKLEGLEQLRLLEKGYKIRCVPVDFQGRANMSGVDSPEDIARAEALIDQHGELLSEEK